MHPAEGDRITSLAILTPSAAETETPTPAKPAGKSGGKAQKAGAPLVRYKARCSPNWDQAFFRNETMEFGVVTIPTLENEVPWSRR